MKTFTKKTLYMLTNLNLNKILEKKKKKNSKQMFIAALFMIAQTGTIPDVFQWVSNYGIPIPWNITHE